jgi:hypothetical protein
MTLMAKLNKEMAMGGGPGGAAIPRKSMQYLKPGEKIVGAFQSCLHLPFHSPVTARESRLTFYQKRPFSLEPFAMHIAFTSIYMSRWLYPISKI